MSERLENAIWPGWEITREIGRGGCGIVYEIQKDISGTIDRAVLKTITLPKERSEIAELYSDGHDENSIRKRYEELREELVNEYRMMVELKGHRNIVYCDDLQYYLHEDGLGWNIYIKMELLTPLTEYAKKPLQDKQVIKVGMDICRALMVCNQKNIIHRDIKPQNIFVAKDGNFKLGDFGVAKTVEKISTGTKTGTYKYMAPEVYNNKPYGASCDIYSLGIVLYWLLNEHRLPFLPLPPQVPTASEDTEAFLQRMSGREIPAPKNGSDKLQRIVQKACAFQPDKRYQSAAEMYEELEKVEKSMDLMNEETVGIFGGEEVDDVPEIKNEKKSRLVALLLAVFPPTGLFGIHDFYLQKKTALLKLCTLNFASMGWLYDVFALCVGIYKDKDGERLK